MILLMTNLLESVNAIVWLNFLLYVPDHQCCLLNYDQRLTPIAPIDMYREIDPYS
jgi:hypothetical protein